MWFIPTKDKAGQDVSLEVMAAKLKDAVEASRFTVHGWDLCRFRDYIPALKVSSVRLRKAKDYCGQHPGPCLAFGLQRHRRGRWLEGADWIGFNAMVNDLFDRLKLSVDVFSYNRDSRANKYYIRRGLCRRVVYDMKTEYGFGRPFSLWTEDTPDNFLNCCGKKPPKSRFPDDTPGIPVYTMAEEAKWLREYEHVEVS